MASDSNLVRDSRVQTGPQATQPSHIATAQKARHDIPRGHRPINGQREAPEREPALLSAHGRSVRLGGDRVLEDIDLAASRWPILTLIGRNSSGKSRLLRALIGAVRTDVGESRRAPRPRLRIGYFPQRLYRDPTLPQHCSHSPASALRQCTLGHPRTARLI